MIRLEIITPQNAAVFKAARLAALLESPGAFASTYEKERQLSDADWLQRAARWTSETSVGYLAVEADIPCGIISSFLVPQDSSVAEVGSMWIAPPYRRQGIGQSLIEKILLWARSRGVRTLKLMVTSNNDRAILFYQRLGFSLTGNTVPYPNDPALVEFEMSLQLP